MAKKKQTNDEDLDQTKPKKSLFLFSHVSQLKWLSVPTSYLGG